MDKEKFELTELGLNIRHWENLRWVSMTVFVAVMGGLGIAVLGAGGIQLPKLLLMYAKFGGLLLVGIFWTQDERIVAYWRKLRDRAAVVEGTVGVQIFSTSPRRGLFSGGVAVRVLYASFALTWILLLFQS